MNKKSSRLCGATAEWDEGGLVMWPFKRKPLVDADTAEWHANNFSWLIRQFGGAKAFAETKLVLCLT